MIKISKFDLVPILTATASIISLGVLIHQEIISVESFWNNLTYFLLFGFFASITTFVGFRLKRHQNQNQNKNKKYDIKKLNNEVFKKLMRVVCADAFYFFEGKVNFLIPLDKKAFSNKMDSEYISWFQSLSEKDLEKKFDILERQIPNLKIGEQYLQKNYPNVYDMWVSTKQGLDKLNKDRNLFFKAVSNQILKEFETHFKLEKSRSKKFDSTAKLRLSPFGNGWAYFEDNIPIVLSIMFNNYNMKFSEDFNENQNYIHFGGYRLIGINDKDRISTSHCEWVFRTIVQDSKNSGKKTELDIRLIELNQKTSKFGDELEKIVVHDIDALI